MEEAWKRHGRGIRYGQHHYHVSEFGRLEVRPESYLHVSFALQWLCVSLDQDIQDLSFWPYYLASADQKEEKLLMSKGPALLRNQFIHRKQ